MIEHIQDNKLILYQAQKLVIISLEKFQDTAAKNNLAITQKWCRVIDIMIFNIKTSAVF